MLNKKETIAYGLLTTIFMFIQLVCRTLELKGNMDWNAKSIIIFLGISIAFAALTLGVIFLLGKYKANFAVKIAKEEKKASGKKLFFISWLVIFVCWLPIFLAYYPGILAYDSYVQIQQIASGVYNNHHPLLHTFIIEAFIKLGGLIGNVNLGVALYTITQMLCLSATMAAGVALLAKRGVKSIWLWIVVLYCGLCPANSYLAISMTKDVFFTVFVLLFIFVLLELLEEKKQHFMWHIAYVGVAVFMMLFRNNGKYALLAFLCLTILLLLGEVLFKKKNKAFCLLGETVVSLILSSVILGGLNSSVSATEGDKREMLSIPIQQIARCMVYHGGLDMVENGDDTISDADKTIINEFILYNGYLEYDPLISDPVKSCTNTWVVVNKLKEFGSMYIRLALDYPEEYINAFLAVSGGYLSVLDESHGKVNLHEEIEGLGYLQTRWVEETLNQVGIYKESKLPTLYAFLEKFAGNNEYLNIPIVRTLVAPGAYLWCYLVLGLWVFFRREKKYQLPLFFVAGYYATLFFGPTVQLRYLYPVMALLPFIYLYVLYGRKLRA